MDLKLTCRMSQDGAPGPGASTGNGDPGPANQQGDDAAETALRQMELYSREKKKVWLT